MLPNRKRHRFVIHCVDLHGDTQRHKDAAASWDAAGGEESMIDCHLTSTGLPKLKTVLEQAMRAAPSADMSDVVVWTNSDVRLTPDSFSNLRRHAGMWGACSMRRHEPGASGVHVGRELFAFRVDWLFERIGKIPDFYLGAPCFDLVLAAMIRLERGIKSTLENLHDDFYPCELPPGSAIHEAHASAWAGDNEFRLPQNGHNRQLAREWCQANCPTLIL